MKACAKCDSKLTGEQRKFCGSTCANAAMRKVRPQCKNCGEACKTNRSKYCGSVCSGEAQHKKVISEWKQGVRSGIGKEGRITESIRKYMLEKAQYKCSECGWNVKNPYSNLIPLEIDHIDGNWENTKEENLRVLCPNCHSLTPTYGSLNRSGRPTRRKSKRQQHEN